MMWVGHMLDHVPDHVLDDMIMGLMTTALHFANLKKCCFYKDEVQFLSYVISSRE